MGGGRIVKTAAELENEVTKLAHTLDLEQVADVEIDKGLELIEEVHKYLERMDVGSCKGCIAVLGTTGVGKSTLVSLLFGEGRLLVHHENEYSRVLVAEKPLAGVDIHSGSSSKTLLPGVIRTRIGDEDVVVFDMPGSHDTRGPFAELVVHSILKWMLAKHEQMKFLLVATPPQQRPQGIGLANTINRVYDGSSNAVLVYMKCDADFEPGSTTILEGIETEKRKIPAFALLKPAKSDREGLDYSSKYQVAKRVILKQLVAPVSSIDVFEGSVPESAQLLLQNFCKRSIAKARHAISQEFLRAYRPDRLRRSFDEISALLDALIHNLNSVSKAAKRLRLMERWTGGSLVICKEEWLTEECRV
ncbi:hypothetical protein PR003_g29105 [Phytophthora rubi]|uniref:Uncharacterized protein n=1 Tax=Phytophthora rubi TaxID=129364 RepID=A0A6A4BKB6_9STRA|nr:hypothetical protein PR003_g29105 [Phytophthora rubi]